MNDGPRRWELHQLNYIATTNTSLFSHIFNGGRPMQKITYAALGGMAVLAAVLSFVSPILAFRHLESAAKSGDRDALEAAIDFPAVRQSFKDQISAMIVDRVRNDPGLRGNIFAGIGALLLPAIADRIVDSVVTPDAISGMILRAKFSPNKSSTRRSAPAKPPSVGMSYGYMSVDRFRVRLFQRDDPRAEASIAFIMEREGLISWKLARIELPQDVLFPPSPITPEAVCQAALTEAEAKAVIPGGTQVSPNSASKVGKGFACAASTGKLNYWITAKVSCRDVSSARCVQLWFVGTDKRKVLYQRAP
jgi:hypothetical protein